MTLWTKIRSNWDRRRQEHRHVEDDSNDQISFRYRRAQRARGLREMERERERNYNRYSRVTPERRVTSNEDLATNQAEVVPTGLTQEPAQDLVDCSDAQDDVSTYECRPGSRVNPVNTSGIQPTVGVGNTNTFPPRHLPLTTPEILTTRPFDTTSIANVSSSKNSKGRVEAEPKAKMSTELATLCLHKLRTGCTLSSIRRCCACEDQRPHESAYLVYVDGAGEVAQGTRWQAYCSSCSEYWNSRKGLGIPNPNLAQKFSPTFRVRLKPSLSSPITPANGRNLGFAPPPSPHMRLIGGVLFIPKSGCGVSGEQFKEQDLQEWLQRHFEKTVRGRRPFLKPKRLPNLTHHSRNADRHGSLLTGEDSKISRHLEQYCYNASFPPYNHIKDRKPVKDGSFTEWRKGNGFGYEPEPDYDKHPTTCKIKTISTRNIIEERYSSFFRAGEPFSALLNNYDYGMMRTPDKVLSRSGPFQPLGTPKVVFTESRTAIYHFIYWIDRFWCHGEIWKNWTSQTPAWMINRGLPTIGDLRSYIARELRIRDPHRLRIHAVVSGRSRGIRNNLVDDTLTLKNAGLDSDCHIVVGWADGIWVQNLLSGLNYGRRFLLCVPGLDSGKARVGNIRILIAKKLRTPDPRMIRLFVEGKELLDDRRTTEQESLHWVEGDTAPNDHQLQCAIILEDLSWATKPWRALQYGETGTESIRRKTRKEEVLSSMLKLALDASSRMQKDFYEEQIQHFREFETFKWTSPGTQCCIVCGEDKYPFEFPTGITRRCDHSPHICDEDLIGWVASELQNKAWDRIKCPECPELMQNEDIKSHAAAKTFERYEGFEVRAALSRIPDFRWCLSPNCSGGQIHETGTDGPIFRCNACGYRVCIMHNQKWHENETCEQFDYRVSGRKARDEEEATKKTIAATTKNCTKCLSPIEKNKGCDHMTCSRCGSEFCWLCLADYTQIRRIGNSEHEKSCIYHSNNIRG